MNISVAKYARALSETLISESDPLVIEKKINNLFLVLRKKKKLKYLKTFLDVFISSWMAKKDQVKVKATFPFETSEEQDKELITALEKTFGKKIVFEKKVNPDVLGGVKLEFEDKVLDATVRKNLDILKNKLIGN